MDNKQTNLPLIMTHQSQVTVPSIRKTESLFIQPWFSDRIKQIMPSRMHEIPGIVSG